MATQKGFGINSISKKILPFISPTTFLYLLRKKGLERKYSDKKLIIGLYSSIKESIIGEYVFINERVAIKNSSIDDHSYINSNSSVFYAQIGKFSSIASNVTIGLSMHPSRLISTHPAFYSNSKMFRTFSDKNYFKEIENITIGNDVWIGEGALIMGGVKIGDGAIIAARSVVTKDIEPFEIVGGVPAKTISFRFEPEIIAKIQKSEWWNNNEEWFLKNYKIFHSVKCFLEYFNL
jgi:acetyltransferase-like isoleucine patch superfamily enzyme